MHTKFDELRLSLALGTLRGMIKFGNFVYNFDASFSKLSLFSNK